VTEDRRDPLAEVVASGEGLDSRILRGSAWVAVSYGGRSMVSLLTTLVLVHLLEPKAFGLVALAWTVLVICDQVQNAGTASAFVFRRHDVERAAASAAVFSFVSAFALLGVAVAVAPLVADAFHTPALTNVLRVLALLLIVKSVGVVPLAILERNIDFRTRSKCELTGAIAQGGVSLAFAFSGWGVWSIVFGMLAGSAVQSSLAWVVAPWRPNPRLANLGVMRELVRYGRYVSATNIVNLANNTVDNVVVGRLLGASTLGFYTVGFRLADFPNTVIGHVVGRVMFPVYSLLQRETDRFRRVYIQNLQRVALFALPVSVTVLIAAEPIVHTLLGAKWEPTITPLRILGAYGLLKSFSAPSGEVFKGAGKPHLGLLLGLLQIAVAVPALVLLVPARGITGAALAMLLTMAVCGSIRFVVSLRLLGASLGEVARSLAPSLLCAGVLAATIGLLVPATESLGDAAGLAVLVAGGALAYVAATLAFARSIVGPMWGGLRGVGV
jgi:O-antigen/teichoic acid export membrane protein